MGMPRNKTKQKQCIHREQIRILHLLESYDNSNEEVKDARTSFEGRHSQEQGKQENCQDSRPGIPTPTSKNSGS